MDCVKCVGVMPGCYFEDIMTQ